MFKQSDVTFWNGTRFIFPFLLVLLLAGFGTLVLSRPVTAIPPWANFPAVIDLAGLNGSNGFRLNGVGAYDRAGYGVSFVGDVNQDGFDDLLIGAPTANYNTVTDIGVCYLVFGRPIFPANFNLGALNGSNGFQINGIAAEDQACWAVAPAGDVNNDGYADFILGAPFADANGDSDAGQSYVIFGQATFTTPLNLGDLDGNNGFRLEGINPGDYAGGAVGGAGDLNHDGYDDLVIGARLADPAGNSDAGEAYVVFGQATFSATFDLANLNGTNGFRLTGVGSGDLAGGAVGPAGNLNGDLYDDLVVAAPLADPAGESYVIFGQATFTASLSLATLNGNNGFTLPGINPADESGRSVSTASDVNQDGFADLLIGAPMANNQIGQSYLVFGRAIFTPTLPLASLDGNNGVRLEGVALGDQAGWAVAPAGDLNNDTFPDFMVGAPLADAGGDSDAGSGYLIFGQTAFSPTLSLAALDGNNGFRMDGIAIGDQAGWTVGGWGDLNGNGVPDIVIGAPQATHGNETNAGESYVIFDTFVPGPTNTPSSATPTATSQTPTLTPTVPTATPTNTPTAPTTTPTNTPTGPTATPTNTPIAPTTTPTNTPITPTTTPTNTPTSLTATPTNTPPTPSSTPTSLPPTITPTHTPGSPSPTPTNTPTLPTPTNTPSPTSLPATPTPTPTPLIPTPTPTATALPPTDTPMPPTLTPTNAPPEYRLFLPIIVAR